MEFIANNDALMADKGFLIEKELALLDLQLNIPPLHLVLGHLVKAM